MRCKIPDLSKNDIKLVFSGPHKDGYISQYYLTKQGGRDYIVEVFSTAEIELSQIIEDIKTFIVNSDIYKHCPIKLTIKSKKVTYLKVKVASRTYKNPVSPQP
ncbi:MAG: hypothetical protein C0446_08490 [Chitinophaga sp.]|nr:hypothetical protein [Chitinophaga sp.]